ncbi:hypothetical protein DMA12_06255 [Amycolatopsis balhimycina DSM 5908]|uniref:Uncharacterized protein n=1 Tax=Amycolatopsis balhimycina DSM 5908 TaxID=1081091 RepID=A0A428X0C0_AMYBA|nr:hypothetical protein DMA12_06255 [Amycolatopsis balhimycina DSM 5908]
MFACYVVLLAWLDWIIHRSVVFVIVVGGGLIAAAVLRSRIAERLRPQLERLEEIPVPVQRLLISLAPLVYFLLRGQGTSGAGFAVTAAGALVASAVVFLGPKIDPPLGPFYAVRDRLLARWVRVLLAPVFGILVAFLVVHGSLADLPALFGGTTESPQSPVDESGRFFLATLLAGTGTVLLLREGGEKAR